MGACMVLRQKAPCSLLSCPANMLVYIWAELLCRPGSLSCSVLCSVCFSSLAMAEVAPAHGRGGGHRAPGSSWKIETGSRDTNASLVGHNLGRGLETLCCSTNSVNDILSPVFSTDLLAHVANVLNCFFPRTAKPLPWISQNLRTMLTTTARE